MTKLFAVMASLALAAAVAAQHIQLLSPTDGQLVNPGQKLDVSVARPNSHMDTKEIGIGITIKSCYQTRICVNDGSLGTVLYAGPYDPKGGQNMAIQNFSVTVPNNLSGGNLLLSVAHASLDGPNAGFCTGVVNATLHLGDGGSPSPGPGPGPNPGPNPKPPVCKP